ncbi:MAG: elongation factor P [Phycisphaerae bacterium]|jgi:elongation factor P|nr:elongation factor P [Phycisphaerae bacterium]MBT5408683.1 elongation factor P [Phycisphaerae bacterium]MBT6164471.1 elongation factor P [Phycisphaerae bacterium]MBT7657455.1 elongation factor P [Phycisphaerae bacterium]|tara:strand:- start:9042 stop:9617 length:576 start_codon:yes stop_codon:yes gene_type:complete
MPIKSTELRRGQALIYDGKLQIVIDTEFVKPGKGPAYVQVKMKNLDTGTIKINRFNSSDKVEDVNIDKRTMQFLYDSSGQGKGPWVFMDNETYDQIELAEDVVLPTQSQWLKDGLDVTVLVYNSNALGIDLPASVELAITETTDQAKAATATNQLKEAIVETGARVRVPPFIEVGQVVKINTDSGEYLGKA